MMPKTIARLAVKLDDVEPPVFLRDVQQRLVRTHGNLERAAGLDMTFITSDYNTMATIYGLPGRFKDD